MPLCLGAVGGGGTPSAVLTQGPIWRGGVSTTAVLGLALSPGSGLCPHPQVPLGISVGQAGVHVHGSQGT